MTPQSRKRIIIAGLAAVVIAAIVFGFLPDAIPVETRTVERGPLQVTFEEEGETRLEDVYVVSSPVPAFLRRVELDPGDAVEAGQPLAYLEPPRAAILDPRTRAEAAARVRAAEASLAQARAIAEQAVTDAERTNALLERGSATRQAAERASVEAERAVAARDAAEAELAAARAALRTTEGEALPVQDVLRAPVAGRVLVVHRESSGHVNPGEPILELGDTDRLQVVVDVLSQDAVRIRPGTPVVIDQWGGETELRGVVNRIDPQGFSVVSALGVEERRVLVRVDLPDPPAELGPGFRVLARFIVWEGADVLQVPTSALFRYGDGWAVFVVDGGRAERRPVRIGQQAGLSTQILDGLAEGEVVIIHPGNEVDDGVRVSPGG